MNKKHHTLGCCGLDCGLCPRFYTSGPSRCPGCCGEDFFNKHPSCPFVTCCAKKKDLEVCAQCDEYPCTKFDKETGLTDSFITHRKVRDNQKAIQESGLDAFIEQQAQRIAILEKMLEHYDDGKSKSYYCIAAALLSLDGLARSIQGAEQEVRDRSIDRSDFKTKAKVLRQFLEDTAQGENAELKLRKR